MLQPLDQAVAAATAAAACSRYETLAASKQIGVTEAAYPPVMQAVATASRAAARERVDLARINAALSARRWMLRLRLVALRRAFRAYRDILVPLRRALARALPWSDLRRRHRRLANLLQRNLPPPRR